MLRRNSNNQESSEDDNGDGMKVLNMDDLKPTVNTTDHGFDPPSGKLDSGRGNNSFMGRGQEGMPPSANNMFDIEEDAED